ncbi:MAG: M48 family metallopeptidase [Acidobacteriota bacterium]|nr:M48 family metallopeptidase [Acidobacteriota bacterium]
MHSNFSRRLGAAVVLFSLFSGVTLTPAAVFGQETQQQTQTAQTTKDKKEKKSDKNNKQQASSQPSAEQVAQANGKRALSPNEDPAMIGKRNINKGLGGWLGGSMEKEVQFGRQLAAEAEKELKLVDDPMITEYVNRVGQNVVNHSDAKVPFTIKVVDSDDVNAFALPGGFFYVNRGLILAADNESELAGVMAHEIAHVAARHAMENQGKATLLNYGMLAGIIFGGGIISPILQNAGGILGGLTMLKFTRGAEEEADKLGVQYLYAAGYDPNGMATMFEKLAAKNKKKPGTIQKLFSTHPQAPDRRDATIALVSRFPEREEYVMSTSEFQKVKKYLLRLSNAKATIAGDIDETENSRPTLKKRPQEDPNAPATTPGTTEEKKNDGPPVLKKRTEPTPSPSPSK